METFGSALTKPIPKKFYKIVGLIIGLLLLLYLAFRISDAYVDKRVQLALDAKCGQGEVSVKDGHYTYEPDFRWDSHDASCFTDIVSGQLTCHCPNSP